MTALLPALAVAQVTRVDGSAPVLVATRRSQVLHLHRSDARRRAFTPAGVLRRGRTPMCGGRGLRWRRASIDGRPLCRNCSRAAVAMSPAVDGTQLARLVPLEQVLATIETARTEHDLSAAQILATHAGYLSRTFPNPGGPPLRLTQVIGKARDRLSTKAAPLGPRDHAWATRRLRPVPRFPRRVR